MVLESGRYTLIPGNDSQLVESLAVAILHKPTESAYDVLFKGAGYSMAQMTQVVRVCGHASLAKAAEHERPSAIRRGCASFPDSI